MSSSEDKNAAAVVGPARRWLFGSAAFDELSLELTVAGHAVELERKPLEVLRHLLLHAGEVVTKDELAEACWPGRILSDSVLSKTLSKLREALGDEAQNLIKTVHGYGYRLVAAVKIEAITAPVAPRFDFVAGDTLPSRPLWKLQERLGTGGHGEAWRVQHEKTHEARVFKFALDGNVLSSLKREITLYRLLHDSLGERGDFVRLLDWNLNEPPYFLESEYTDGGNLQIWAESQGGLQNIPLYIRLDLIVQIAEALAAAHSVGVLHKDLKPSNVLIHYKTGEPPRIKLADFGSGGVLDPQKLEALGITRLGFTQTLAADDTSGTLHYVAPEVMAGQPSTVQADIYALGVMLYQLVIGDLRKPPSSGWEQDISDGLLREDIADSTNGNPGRRMADASLLAQRLRTLERRRQQRAAERQAAQLAELARRELERARVRRSWMLTSLAVLALGMTTTAAFYWQARQAQTKAEQAQKEAEKSAATSKAVRDFMTLDLLRSVDTNNGAMTSLTVQQVMDRAVATVDERFKDQPEVAAEVHMSAANSYGLLGSQRPALAQAMLAVSQFETLYGRADEKTVRALELLSGITYELGHYADAQAQMRDLVNRSTELWGRTDWKTLEFRADLAWILTGSGAPDQAADELRAALADATRAASPNESVSIEMHYRLGHALVFLGAYEEAERTLAQVLELHARRTEPQRPHAVAKARLMHGRALTHLGQLDRAQQEVETAVAAMETLLGKDHTFTAAPRAALGELRLEQGRLPEAAALLERARAQYVTAYGAGHRFSIVYSTSLAEIYQRQRRFAEAIRLLRETLGAAEQSDAADPSLPVRIRSLLAESLLLQGQTGEAQAVLDALAQLSISAIPERHPNIAHLRRIQGLLWLRQGDLRRARAALSEALAIYELRHGSQHWRARRGREELARLAPE